MAILRAMWRSLRTEDASSPPGHRLGIARRRMDLLASFPAWRIPEIIDELNRPEAEEVTHA